MERLERIDLLEKAKNTLKSEFVGLDNIIDEVCTAITPWFITPEINERPVIISLFGMTGTGKTSVVRKLIELLDLGSKTFFFNCAGDGNESSSDSITDKIKEFLDADEGGGLDMDDYTKDFVFVFDEIQHARTIDESGCEVSKSNLQAIWSLVDSGILDLNSSDWDLKYLTTFVEDLGGFVETSSHANFKLSGICELTDRNEIKEILNDLGFFHYERGVPDLIGAKAKYGSHTLTKVEDIEDPCKPPLRVIDDRCIRIIGRRMKAYKVSPKEIVLDLSSCTTLWELHSKLKLYMKKVAAPTKIKCTGSLIFLLGNIDEAFRVEGNTTPDLDPDIFYDETSKVTISDIKTALKTRFRAEQIARLGNTIIKYPTLRGSDFKEIIRREIFKIFTRFSEISGIDVRADESIVDLLYSEGVFPTQGVRPVFTTINTILTPLLSNILIKKQAENKLALITVKDPGSGYNLPSKHISIFLDDSPNDIGQDIHLSLGSMRDPKNRKTRYISSVHEIGHAVVYSFLTGCVPNEIVSVSVDRGGFCTTYNPDRVNEIKTKRDIQNDVRVSMAGLEAEELIYGSDNILLGSGSDIEDAWESLSHAVYSLGYFDNIRYASYEVTNIGSGIPCGCIDFREDSIAETMNYNIKAKIKNEFDNLLDSTRDILKSNTDLIKKAAIELANKGKMTGIEFKKFIEEYGNTLTLDRLEEALQENSYENYLLK